MFLMRREYRLYEDDDGDTKVTIDLRVRDDGALQIEGYDIGESVEKAWGDSDYEYWVMIPREALTELALALILEHSQGDQSAVSKLKSQCMKHSVARNHRALTKLAIALIREHYQGNRSAVSMIEGLCIKYGVAHRFESWT